ITGKTEIHSNRWRQIVHLIASRQSDLKNIHVARGAFKIDGELPRLLGFEQVAGFYTDYARAKQEQITRGFSVVLGDQGIIELEGLIGLTEIGDGSFRHMKGGERTSQKHFDRFNFVDVL